MKAKQRAFVKLLILVGVVYLLIMSAIYKTNFSEPGTESSKSIKEVAISTIAACKEGDVKCMRAKLESDSKKEAEVGWIRGTLIFHEAFGKINCNCNDLQLIDFNN